MQARLIDYVHRDSPLHRLDARWKLAAVMLMTAAVVALQTLPAAAAALLGTMLMLSFARLPWRWFAARLAGVAAFLSLFLILLPLTLPGDGRGWDWGPVRIYSHGLVMALTICLKALAVVALALLLVATAPFETLLKAAHQLWAPGRAVQLLMLTYRYLYLLADELAKLRIALRVRGFRNRASVHAYRTIGHVSGTLLVRSYERAERVAQAMRCRGFAGRFYSLHRFRTRLADVALTMLLIAAGAAVLAWDRFLLITRSS
jgi:cobalt/nickel transport system permease protein